MCCCEGKDYAAPDKAAADAILSKYRGVLGSLISILQEIQEAYGYIPKTLIPYISEKTEYEAAKIFGVATFYSQFRLEPVGRHLIMLCQGTACHVNGSAIIEEAIQNELGIADGETTPDGLFTLENVACLGCCSLSPVMMIGDTTYGTLTPDKARKILREIRAKEAAQQ